MLMTLDFCVVLLTVAIGVRLYRHNSKNVSATNVKVYAMISSLDSVAWTRYVYTGSDGSRLNGSKSNRR